MSQASAFGFSGFDPFGTVGESLINGYVGGSISNYFNKKAAKRSAALEWQNIAGQMALQYEYAQRYALNNPSWQVAGLRAAGLNPILAATDGAFASPTLANASSSVKQDSPSIPSHSSVASFNRSAQKLMDAETDKLVSEKKLTDVKADNERKNRGLSGGPAFASRIGSEVADFINGRQNETGVVDNLGVHVGRSSPSDNFSGSSLPELTRAEKLKIYNSIFPKRNEDDKEYRARVDAAILSARRRKAESNYSKGSRSKSLPFTSFSR